MQQRDREVFLSILWCMKFTLPLVILINILCLGNVVGIYTTLGNPSLVEGLKKLDPSSPIIVWCGLHSFEKALL